MNEDPAGADPSASEREATLADLEARLGHTFADRRLLETALVHSSFAHKNDEVQSNERLEFLGDAVLGLLVAHALFESHGDWSEGDLSRAQASLIDRRSLARVGSALCLGECLRLGKTEQSSGGGEKATILADATEAVLGALYLDGGLERARAFVQTVFADALDPSAPRVERDPKTALNECVMAQYSEFPTYQLTRDSGVDEDEERFSVAVSVQGTVRGEGSGRTKRAAEVAAARMALLHEESGSA